MQQLEPPILGNVCYTDEEVFLSDPGIPGVRSMGPSLSKSCLVDLTDVTLVDEDTNSKSQADDTNRAIPSNLEMQVRESYLVRKSFFVRKSCLVRKSYLVRKIYLGF